MLLPRILNRLPNNAVEDKYADDILFRLLAFVCKPLMSEAKEYAIFPGELFYNCVFSLDSLKGRKPEVVRELCAMMLDETIRYFNDKGLDKDALDVQHAISLVVYGVERCLLLTKPGIYTLPASILEMRLYEANSDYQNLLKKRFNKAIKYIGEPELKQYMTAYMKSPKILSDEIGTLIDECQNTENIPVEKQSKPRKRKEPVQLDVAYMTFKMNGIAIGHINLLHQKLCAFGWIPKDTPADDFSDLFSGKAKYVKIQWNIGKGTLLYLFSVMYKQKKISIDKGYTVTSILEHHFVDENGQLLSGLHSGKAGIKVLPLVNQCFKILLIEPPDLEPDSD